MSDDFDAACRSEAVLDEELGRGARLDNLSRDACQSPAWLKGWDAQDERVQTAEWVEREVFGAPITEFRPPIAHEGKPLHWIDAGAGPQPVMWRMGMWWVIGQGRPVSLHQAAEWAWRYLAPVEWGAADKRIADLEADNTKLRAGIDQCIAELEVRLHLRNATQHVPSQAAEKAEKTGEKAGKAAPLPANALCHGWAKR